MVISDGSEVAMNDVIVSDVGTFSLSKGNNGYVLKFEIWGKPSTSGNVIIPVEHISKIKSLDDMVEYLKSEYFVLHSCCSRVNDSLLKLCSSFFPYLIKECP